MVVTSREDPVKSSSIECIGPTGKSFLKTNVLTSGRSFFSISVMSSVVPK